MKLLLLITLLIVTSCSGTSVKIDSKDENCIPRKRCSNNSKY